MAKKPTVVQDRPRCRDCPLWTRQYDYDFNDINVPAYKDGQPVVRNNVVVMRRHLDGTLVRMGMCGVELPRRATVQGVNGVVTVPAMLETPSDWFCESPEKHAAIERMKKLGLIK